MSYTKSDHDRIILMTPGTEAALRALRSHQVAAREAAGDRWEKRPEFAHLVFTGTLGQPVNPREELCLVADALRKVVSQIPCRFPLGSGRVQARRTGLPRTDRPARVLGINWVWQQTQAAHRA